MRIGVPREIKVHEYRVGLVPAAVHELVAAGHTVAVESGAGAGIGCADEDYRAAGASIAPSAEAVFAGAELIVKVKEPQPQECARLKPGQVLFTYLHLAADKAQAEALQRSGATAIAYETVTAKDGSLPLLTPMSEVAGRMSVQVGAHYLEKAPGGRGILLGGVAGVPPARVVIIGGGVSGTGAAEMALGLRADVCVIDRSLRRLRELDTQFNGSVRTLYSTAHAIGQAVADADLVIGAVLVPASAAPKLVTRSMVRSMRAGSVVVDIAIDQGGVLRDQPADHACRADLRRARCRALLRDEHAWRRAADLGLRAQQRHAAVRAGAGRQGMGAGDARGSGTRRRRQRCWRAHRASRGGARSGHRGLTSGDATAHSRGRRGSGVQAHQDCEHANECHRADDRVTHEGVFGFHVRQHAAVTHGRTPLWITFRHGTRAVCVPRLSCAPLCRGSWPMNSGLCSSVSRAGVRSRSQPWLRQRARCIGALARAC